MDMTLRRCEPTHVGVNKNTLCLLEVANMTTWRQRPFETAALCRGGSNSPIFDAKTIDLIGIHLVGYVCARGGEAQRHSGAGTSFARLLTAIRGQ